MNRTRIATYTDGTPVREGDRIRYQQTPGGLIPASGEWTYGIAAKRPYSDEERASMEAFNEKQGYVALDPDEIYLCREEPIRWGSSETRPGYYYIVSHIVERVIAP